MSYWRKSKLALSLLGLPLLANAAPKCENLTFNVTAKAQASEVILPPLSLDNPDLVMDIVNSITGNVGRIWPVIPVSGTYEISATYCEPEKTKSDRDDTVQLLVHGATYSKAYWTGHGLPESEAQKYSWARYAAEEGYATLAIDRLGSGQSAHPDPLLEVQDNLQAEITHEIVEMLRAGEIGGKEFSKVVYVGHSLGSVIGTIASQLHPGDFDALILTGWSVRLLENIVEVLAGGLLPAALVKPKLWGDLHLAYVAFAFEEGIRNAFFGDDGTFDPAVQDNDWENRGTLTLGELLTVFAGMNPATSFENPVQLLIGEYDAILCPALGKCKPGPDNTPGDSADMFPNARFFNVSITPDSGHNLNEHFSAKQSYKAAHEFIRESLESETA